MAHWFRPAGSTARKGFDVAIGPEQAGWEHTGLYVATLAAGESREIRTGGFEWLVLPLSGKVRVELGGTVLLLAGRRSPFEGRTDFAYLPIRSTVRVHSEQGARIAFPHATADEPLPFRRIPAEETVVELRGAGSASRQVNNFGTPSVLNACSIIACEVLTPAGNWSSWPPHKHDEHRPGRESALEEIYYYEMRAADGAPVDVPADAGRSRGSAASRAMGYQRVYGRTDRPINVLAEVRDGDVVLIPHGWHGPSMAPPGYDMYYLNVMAGPGATREWLICDDPRHTWVRDTWPQQPVDPRLPFRGYR